MPRQRERETLKEGGASPTYLPRGPFGQRVPREPRKDDSLWCPRVPFRLTWATGSVENSRWMEGGQMAKGLCLGVGRSHGKENVEKRQCREMRQGCGGGREHGQAVFLWLHRKPIKPLHRVCTAQEGTGRPLEEVLKAQAGR